MADKSKKLKRWYFGGLASAGATCFTHPLDLLKVHLQTTSTSGHGQASIVNSSINIVRNQGFLAMYNGLSASLLRQLTYSTTRFALYDVATKRLSPNGEDILFSQRAMIALVAGSCGGVVGTPGDMINVRMQNDIKLPKDQRRNYKHAFDGVLRVFREEGMSKLFNGALWASGRAALMSMGQLCFYDVIKGKLLKTAHFKDDVKTHITSSFCAGGIATTLTQPLDVLKTRAMNAKPGDFKGPVDLFLFTAKQGPLAFFKGYIPAFVRLGPHTILTFVFLEKLRENFGIIPNYA